MPGPNSAPNGDKGLIRGHKDERFVSCEVCDRQVEKLVRVQMNMKMTVEGFYAARDHDVKHNRLHTGKTDSK